VLKSKSPSVVTVALRLPDSDANLGIPGNRVSDKVRNDTTIWKLLRHLEETGVGKQRRLNLTARVVPQTANNSQSGSGQLYWEGPVLKVAGRELSTLEDFQRTLSQVGIESGSQLLMLDFRKTDIPLEEAMKRVEAFFAEDGAQAAPKVEANVEGGGPIPASGEAKAEEGQVATSSATPSAPEPASRHVDSATNVTAPSDHGAPGGDAPASDAMDLDSVPTSAPPAADPLKPLQVWAPATSSTIAAAKTTDSESAFTPSVAQMQAHQNQISSRTHNSRLKSDAEMAAAAEAHDAKLAAVRKVDIRVRFPDGHIALWSFGPDATGASLHQAVRAALARSDLTFKLVLPAGGGEIQDDAAPKHRLIRGYDLKGGVLVTLIALDAAPDSVRSQTFLKQGLLSHATEVKVPEVPQGQDVEEEVPRPAAAPVKNEGDAGLGKKLPKWLKLPGKK